MTRFWIFFHGRNLVLPEEGLATKAAFGFSKGVSVFACDSTQAKEKAAQRLFRDLERTYGREAISAAELRAQLVYTIPWYSRHFRTEVLMLLEGNPDFDG